MTTQLLPIQTTRVFLKVVFHLILSLIRIWWYPLFHSTNPTLKIPLNRKDHPTCRWFKVSEIYTWFDCNPISTHILYSPFFLGTRWAQRTNCDKVEWGHLAIICLLSLGESLILVDLVSKVVDWVGSNRVSGRFGSTTASPKPADNKVLVISLWLCKRKFRVSSGEFFSGGRGIGVI